jgi:hypothetical protein
MRHGQPRGTSAYKPVTRFADPALIVAFLCGLNAFASSAASAVLWMTVVAATLGASIPALIYAGTRAWAALTREQKGGMTVFNIETLNALDGSRPWSLLTPPR